MEQLDLIAQRICSKYPRPAKFSDPGADFSEEELSELIRKQDSDLTEGDLMCIFQGALPAGEYQEVMYFLPIALKHIAEDKEIDTADNFLCWMGHNEESLRADGCYDNLLDFFELLFAYLTSECVFNGMHMRDGALCDTIVYILNDSHHERGDVLLQKYLGSAENYVQAAWLLYFLEQHYRCIPFHDKSAYMEKVAYDKNLRQKIYDLIVEEAMKDETVLQFGDHKLQYCGLF